MSVSFLNYYFPSVASDIICLPIFPPSYQTWMSRCFLQKQDYICKNKNIGHSLRHVWGSLLYIFFIPKIESIMNKIKTKNIVFWPIFLVTNILLFTKLSFEKIISNSNFHIFLLSSDLEAKCERMIQKFVLLTCSEWHAWLGGCNSCWGLRCSRLCHS